MTRWKITLEYDGTLYAGSQKQPDMPTVQGNVEEALYKFCQKNIQSTFAGRTDAGVHARAQIAHFDLDYKDKQNKDRSLSGFQLSKALNAHLAKEKIVILDAEKVDADFHARFNAKKKHYIYRIVNRPHPLTIDKKLAWWVKKPLNFSAMVEASCYFMGEHDFSSFRDSECQAKSPIRTLDDLTLEKIDCFKGQEILIHARAQSFLHHQIRNIAGTLAYVGEGKFSTSQIVDILKARDRTKAGPTAPAHGLYLNSINYR